MSGFGEPRRRWRRWASAATGTAAALPLLVGLGVAAGAPTSAPGQRGAGQQGLALEPQAGPQGAPSSCIACHGDAELFEPEELAIVEGFRRGVHVEVGLSCHDCHGGNPDPALAEDYVAAKDEDFAPNPYRGVPDRTEVPGFCGRCHSDPLFMRRYRPGARVDQEQEYWTSHHGRALLAGDTNVATCTDCHGVHGILRPSAPDSLVYPTHVASTCSRCHADVDRMAGYTLLGGAPLPVDQYARWRQSVHAAALLDREDLSAPTCNDCHGNHGATPPGVDSIAFVCGQCHGREAEIFRGSPKHLGFAEHNEYLADAGEEGCAACHDPPEPQAAITDLHSLNECAACHGNHGVVRPTLAMLSPLPDTPCAFCHGGPDAPAAFGEEPEEVVRNFEATRDGLLAGAAAAGLGGEERFDWLVDQALVLPAHTLPAAEPGQQPILRPEFRRLFEKFRIGKTAYTYTHPATGELVRAEVRRCDSCHAGPDFLGDDAVGRRVSSELLAHMRRITYQAAQAERILLAARRGGVETRTVAPHIDEAVDAQIGLEVLLHGFTAAEGSPFMARYDEGVVAAEAALEAGQEALLELGVRRRGLVVALGIIALLLVGLALKIREIGARTIEATGDEDRGDTL